MMKTIEIAASSAVFPLSLLSTSAAVAILEVKHFPDNSHPPPCHSLLNQIRKLASKRSAHLSFQSLVAFNFQAENKHLHRLPALSRQA